MKPHAIEIILWSLFALVWVYVAAKLVTKGVMKMKRKLKEMYDGTQ